MEIAAVVDRGTLRDYLEALPDDERRAVSLRVAFNAAARVLPIAARDFLITDWARKDDLSPVAIFGAVTISAVARKMPTADIGRSADAAAAYAYAADAAAYAADADADAYAADAAAYAADAAAAAAAAYAAAAYAADAAAVWGFDLWDLTRGDLTGDALVWPDGVPEDVAKTWAEAQAAMAAHPADWAIWVHWYNRILQNRDWHPAAMGEVLQNIGREDWDKGPTHINPMFDEVLGLYRAEDVRRETNEEQDGGDASEASYFDFLEVSKHMRAVGFPKDQSAFDNDEEREAFSRAVQELQDILGDWCELARAQLQGKNEPVTVVVAIEQLLDQLNEIARGDDVSFRELIRKGGSARRHARSPKVTAALDEVLHEQLIEALDDYGDLVRSHLGHALAALDALRSLELGDLDSAVVLSILKEGVARIEQMPPDALLPPDAKTKAVFNSMLADLEEEESEIGEAITEDARNSRRKRFAERFGGISATFKNYLEKGTSAAQKGGKNLDEGYKWFGRWQKFEKILEWWNSLP